jgi:hypothetical protein
MELNITNFFNTAAPMDYSASIAEIGRDAARDTWQAALDDSADFQLLTTDAQRDEFKAHMQAMGFSEADNFATWTNEALNALCIQLVSGTMREMGNPEDWDSDDWSRYEADENCCHEIFKGDDGQIYYYIGS